MTETPNILVGYVRRSNGGSSIKLSLNTKAMEDCETYTTSDGQVYIPLKISAHNLRKVMNGETIVTTVTQSE